MDYDKISEPAFVSTMAIIALTLLIIVLSIGYRTVFKAEDSDPENPEKYLFDGKVDEGVYVIHHKGREYLVNTKGGICPVAEKKE